MPAEHKPTHVMVTDKITRLACEAALRDGGYVPTVFARGTKKSAMGRIEDMPGTHEARVQRLFQAGMELRQEGHLGLLVQVIFISQAWLRVRQPGDVSMRPSADPARLEVLMVAGLSLPEDSASLTIFEMVREDDKVVDLREFRRQDSRDTEIHSPLLDAFVAGFVMGKRDEHPPLRQ